VPDETVVRLERDGDAGSRASTTPPPATSPRGVGDGDAWTFTVPLRVVVATPSASTCPTPRPQPWVVGDNLLKSAALNTVQLAELLVGAAPA